MSLQELSDISRFYGANPDYVIAGGGNTSFKDGPFLYIKGSGTSLAEISPGDFVKMDRNVLAGIWDKQYPADPDAREAAVLSDMMAARCPGEEGKRPSVETLLHDILPYTYVVHTHPSLVNGITCAQKGEEAARDLFSGDAIWIPSTNPGYVLSRAVRTAFESFRAERGKGAEIIFLQNHGVFVGADSAAGIRAVYERIMNTLGAKVLRKADPGGRCGAYGDSGAFAAELRALAEKSGPGLPWFVRFERNNEIANFVKDRASFWPVSRAFSPDHIVYAGSDPLFVEGAAGEAWEAHLAKTGRIPKIIALRGCGIFGLGNTEKTAATAVELFVNAVEVAVYTESFGGPLFMTEDKIDFINNWEVERYRSEIAFSGGGPAASPKGA
ncbi:MAG: class II aldolase/adducin family protein [Treponema sp.]|nr:class II aldolase/adducin family protein [Treponema sp.]